MTGIRLHKLFTLRRLAIILPLLPLAMMLTLPAWAQTLPTFNIDVGDDALSTRRLFQLIILITVLSLAPSILMMVTSFTRIIVVFSLLRSAMGLQTTPPNPVLVSLALFLTLFIMAPTFEAAYTSGIAPYIDERIDEETAFQRTVAPFREFMSRNANESDLNLFLDMMPPEDRPTAINGPQDIPLQALIPAFMISELKRAFEIGFLIFLPFIIIDLTIASILMSMGMMMLPPVIVSLPFKLIFFVLIDGWHLLAGSLVQSFN